MNIVLNKVIYNISRKLYHKNQTLLAYAIIVKLPEMAELLITKGADVNTKDINY